MTFTTSPQVLNGKRRTYASDVYSFGVLVWEVITTEVPWAKKTSPLEIICTVLQGGRPEFTANAPAAIAKVANDCWVEETEKRPTFRELMEDFKTNGWIG